MRVPLFGTPAAAGASSPASDADGATEDALSWLVMLAGGLVLLAGIWLLGSPIGDLLFRGQPLHPLPIYVPEVMPKPAQFGRFAVTVLAVFAVAVALLARPRRPDPPASAPLARVARAGLVIGQLAIVGVLVWAWRGQNIGINHLTPVQFHLGNLFVAALIAMTVMLAARRGWLRWIDPERLRRRGAIWTLLAFVVTALWLLPGLYRSGNLAHSLDAVWYPLQFTFDDFLSVLDGRTPLVNYDTQYASLMPFVTEPAFKLFGASVGTFTALMYALSLGAFMCVERSLAIVARNGRLALLLYIPVLAVSLFTLRHVGDERYFMANYYEVMPIRYFGPYVLLWVTVRELGGLRPRRAFWIFALAGLVAINNAEFGIPALGGSFLALASAQVVPRAGWPRRLRRLAGELLAGVVFATVAVIVFLLLRSGSLPQLSRLTRYEQIYAVTGFNLVSTPDAGLHVIIFMTFAATLMVAALRIRSMNPDRALTGALVFTGTFGLGAGAYYMGRSFPEVLASMFSVWGLASALLCLVALRALKDSRARIRPTQALPVIAALLLVGLMATTIGQFPTPWTQWRRLTRNSHTAPFYVGPAARFVRSVSRPGAHVALLASLGHLIGREAGVIDISPYSHPDGIVTYEQLDDVLASLRSDHGGTVFTGAVVPEVSQFLTSRGFRLVAHDPSSALSEWRSESGAGAHGS